MWFLLRLALWLGVVILLLPAAPSQKTAPLPEGGAAMLPVPTAAFPRRPSRDTLTTADLAVPWRGPANRPRR